MTLTVSVSKFDDSRVTLAGDITGDITEDEKGPAREKIVNPTACKFPGAKRLCWLPILRLNSSHSMKHYPIASGDFAHCLLRRSLLQVARRGWPRSAETEQ